MIYKYEVTNPVVSSKKPHVDAHGVFIIPNIKRMYKYFVEAVSKDPDTYVETNVLLLSETKFDENCRRCRVDDYGRLKINIGDKLRNYITRECKSRGNVNVDYLESEDNYDVYLVE